MFFNILFIFFYFLLWFYSKLTLDLTDTGRSHIPAETVQIIPKVSSRYHIFIFNFSFDPYNYVCTLRCLYANACEVAVTHQWLPWCWPCPRCTDPL